MASNISFRTSLDVLLAPGGLDFGTLERLVDSSNEVLINIWNNFEAVGGITTARGLLIFPEIMPLITDPFASSGNVFCDQGALWWLLTGVISDPTKGASGGLPQDYVSQTTTYQQITGRGAFVRNIPNRFMRQVKFKINLPAAGGPLANYKLKIGCSIDTPSFPLDTASEQREGNLSIHRHERSRFSIIAGPAYIAGEVDEDPGTVNAPRVRYAAYKIGGRILKGGVVRLPVLSNTDVNGVALLAGEEYDVLIVKQPTMDFSAAGYDEIKGAKAPSGTQIPPQLAAINQIPLERLAKIALADGDGLTSFRPMQSHDDGHIRASGLDLTARVGMRMETLKGIVNDEDGEGIVTAIDNARSVVLQTTGKALSTVLATAGVDDGFSVLGSITAAGLVTAWDRRQEAKASNLYYARRRVIEWRGRMEDQDPDGILPVFGYFQSQNPAGALPQSVLAARGHRCFGRIDTLTTPGVLRFSGRTVSQGDWGGGAKLEEALIDEDHRIADAGSWIITRGRFGGTVGNNPDVALTAQDGLVATVESGLIRLFQNHGLLFHVAGVELRFRITAATATMRFIMKKIPAVGATIDLIDTGPMTAFDGAGGAGTAVQKWVERSLYEMPDGTPLEGAIEDPGHAAIIDPMRGGEGLVPWDGGEGIVAYCYGMQDVDGLEADLYIYPLVIS